MLFLVYSVSDLCLCSFFCATTLYGKHQAEKPKVNDEDAGKKLATAEAKINSSTHHTEWQAFKRWCRNKKRVPQALVNRVNTDDGRASLFKDWVQLGGDVEAIVSRHVQQLEEAQKSEVRYGFRSEKWIRDNHGDTKAERIMQKKESLGLTITCPEDDQALLYFVLINIDVSNIHQLKKITSLETSGGVSPEILAAFTAQGGVLDPKNTTKLGELGAGPGMGKALELMNQGNSGGSSKKGKQRKGTADNQGNPGEATEAIGEGTKGIGNHY